MELHLDYEQAAPFALQRHDRKEAVSKQPDLLPDECVKPKRGLDLGDFGSERPTLKPKLKADKAAGTIEVDAVTTLSGIPPEAWAYQLGNCRTPALLARFEAAWPGIEQSFAAGHRIVFLL